MSQVSSLACSDPAAEEPTPREEDELRDKAGKEDVGESASYPCPCQPENTSDIFVICEQEAEEWALYLKSLFGLIVNKEEILLYNLEHSSSKHQELLCLPSYKCKLLILSRGLLNCLNRKKSYFLEQVLKPPDNVIILLCGVENSEILYEILTLAGGSKEISTDEKPEEYISVVKEIIQPDKPWDENLGGSVSYIYEAVLVDEEINEETLEIEFITDNQRIRIQRASRNKKVKYMKALDFPAGPVNVNVYCGGVIKTTAQIEYYTALEEIEPILKKMADPIGFTCQALKFSSVEKVDNVLTSLLKGKISTHEFSPFQSEEEHHHQANFVSDGGQCCEDDFFHSKKRLKCINAASDFISCKEEVEDSNTYQLMLGSETPPAVAKQNSRDQYAIGSRYQQEVKVDEEKKADLKDSKEETEYEDKEEEDSYSLHSSPSSLYANIGDELKKSRRDCFFCKRPPPPPPRNLPGIQRQDNLHNSWQEKNFVMDRSRREQGDGLTATCCREDEGACQEDSEEEHPYTCVALDEQVYDLILGQEEQEEEKRRRCSCFITNRPPAPAPRPVGSPGREENTPYIVRVFQQKACRVTSDNSRTYCKARNPEAHRGHAETVTYSTVIQKIPPEQEELIHSQEKEKVHHLRDTTIRKRQENENLNVYN